MAESNSSFNSLLIVDDDAFMLKLLKKIFSTHYEVKTASSGPEGLKVITSGFDAGVILSDQFMPMMKGSEFLAKTVEFSPASTRILLTGHSDTKEIIALVNEAKAFMYLTKPFVELDLVQAVKMGFEYHKTAQINKKLIENQRGLMNQIKVLNQKLVTLNAETKVIMDDSVKMINKILDHSSNIYFTDRSDYVSGIALALADEARLRPDALYNISLSARLHNISAISIPERMQLIDPYDFTSEEDLKLFFKSFKEGADLVDTIANFKPFHVIISQLYEHADGTGFPFALTKNEIQVETTFIALAIVYHNRVYRMTEKQYEEYENKGIVIQTAAETQKRHDKVLQFLYNKSSWFEDICYKSFLTVLEKGTSEHLIPLTMDLTLTNKNYVKPE